MAFDDRELDVGRDGTFEFTYVAEPGAKSMIVREVFNDWDPEERGTLTIERPDTLGKPAKELTRDLLAKKYDVAARVAGRLDPDVVRLPPVLPVQGAGQHPDRPAVDAGRPRLAALVDRPLRARRRPGAGHHGAALRRLLLPGRPGRLGLVRLDRLRDPPDLAHQGAGGHRPRRRMRFVVSEQNPGIANWLETTGHRTGALMLRWQRLERDLTQEADGPTVEVVPFADVRDAPAALRARSRPRSTPRGSPPGSARWRGG